MFLAFVTLVFCLLRHSQSAPLSCQELARPLDHISPQDIEGRWVLVAGGVNSTVGLERFKHRDSAVINWSSINDTSMSLFRRDGVNGSCYNRNAEITLQGGGFIHKDINLTVLFIHTTCPDCLVMHFDKPAKSPMPLFLLSRRRSVNDAQLEEFKAQTECMEMSLFAVMDPTKPLCEIGENSSKTSVPAKDGKQEA